MSCSKQMSEAGIEMLILKPFHVQAMSALLRYHYLALNLENCFSIHINLCEGGKELKRKIRICYFISHALTPLIYMYIIHILERKFHPFPASI